MSRKLPIGGLVVTRSRIDRERLLRPLRSLRKTLVEISSEPSTETIHDLRRGTQKLETVTRALAINGVDDEFIALVTRLRRQAGRVRDLDVMMPLAATLPFDGAGAGSDCRAQLMEILLQKRSRRARKLRRSIDRHRVLWRSGISDLSRTIERESRPDCESKTFEQWGTSAEAAARDLEINLELWQEPTERQLHAYRKRIRELRLLLRLWREFDHRLDETLCDVKDSIGLWHDWTLLKREAEEVSAHPAECQILSLISVTQQEKLDAAVAATSRLHREYLDPGSRLALLDSQFAA